MPKSYRFSARYQIDKLLKENPTTWFMIKDIAYSGEVYCRSESNIRSALEQSLYKGRVTRRREGNTYYYQWNSGYALPS